MSDPTLPGSPSAPPDPDGSDVRAERPPAGEAPQQGTAGGGASASPPAGEAPQPNTPWSGPPAGQPAPPPAGGWAPSGPPPAGWPPYGPPPAAPTRRRRAGLIALCLAFLAVGVFLGAGFSHRFWVTHDRVLVVPGGSGSNGLPFGNGGLPFGNSGGSSSSSAPGAPSNVKAIAAKVDPALVDINVSYGALSPGVGGSATGIVLSPSGLVLTNNHVIDQASVIKATDLGNGRTYTATVLGYDASADVALLQLQGASGLKTATLGGSPASVGQPVVAIGNAGGVGGTPSTAGGKVTALDRQITVQSGAGSAQRLSGLIETNAAIQRGDSGGPLVDGAGRVIGVNTAASSTLSPNGQSGRGFAVPIATATAVVTQIQHGQSSATVHVGPTAFLGVELGAPSAATGQGAPVVGVLSGSPAARAGLKTGDTIVAVDGRRVGSSQALTTIIGGHRPGDSVKVGWTDGSGAHHVSTIRLTSGPAH